MVEVAREVRVQDPDLWPHCTATHRALAGELDIAHHRAHPFVPREVDVEHAHQGLERRKAPRRARQHVLETIGFEDEDECLDGLPTDPACTASCFATIQRGDCDESIAGSRILRAI